MTFSASSKCGVFFATAWSSLLKKLTCLTEIEIASLMAEHASNPGARTPQRALARAMTDLLHGEDERLAAEAAAAALFSGDISGLSEKTIDDVFAAVPSSLHALAALDGEGMPLLDLIAQTLCKSRGEAKQALADGSVAVNGKKAGASDRVTADALLHGRVIALRRGKKNWHLTRWE